MLSVSSHLRMTPNNAIASMVYRLHLQEACIVCLPLWILSSLTKTKPPLLLYRKQKQNPSPLILAYASTLPKHDTEQIKPSPFNPNHQYSFTTSHGYLPALARSRQPGGLQHRQHHLRSGDSISNIERQSISPNCPPSHQSLHYFPTIRYLISTERTSNQPQPYLRVRNLRPVGSQRTQRPTENACCERARKT